MAKDLDKFDELLKDALDGHEAPFNELHWEELEEELNVVAPGMSNYFSAVTTGLVATSLVFMSMLFLLSDGNGVNSDHEDEVIVVAENTGTGSGTVKSDETNNAAFESSSDDESTESGTHNSEIEHESISAVEETDEANASNTFNTAAKSSTKSTENDTADNTEVNSENNSNESVVVASSVKAEKKNIRTGCTGLTIDFTAKEEYGNNAKFLWNFGDGYFSTESNPSHTFNKEGTFDVSLSVTSPGSGQITSNVVQAMIEIVEAPIANVDVEINGPTTVSVFNKSYNANDVEWRIDGATEGNGSSVSVSVADNTSYEVHLSALNEGGCVDTLESTIRSIQAGSEFPRAYDTSYGNAFAPGAIIDEGEVQSIKIYSNKTGDLVFEGSGNKGWYGETPQGEKANKGAYKWVMAVVKEDVIDVYHGDLEVR